jgi:hypothetical protein
VAVTAYGALYSPDGSLNSVAAETLLMQNSLRDKVVVHFASTGARDTATAGLLAAIPAATGMVCHVTSKGWYGYDGPTSTWKQFSMQGYTFAQGNAQGNTDGNGIRTIAHGLGVAPQSVQVTIEGDNASAAVLKPVVVQITSTNILVKFYNTTTGVVVPNNTFASYYWHASV